MGSADPSSICADPDVLAAAVSRLLDPLVGRIDRDGQYPGQALQELGGLGFTGITWRPSVRMAGAMSPGPSMR